MRYVWLAAALIVSPVLGQEAQQHGEHGKLGTVTFANSCSADVQPAFARGMALLHSFEFGSAIDAFTMVSDKDPSCAMAQWGTGLAQWGNPFSAALRPAPQLEAGRKTLERAAAAGAKTPRERGFITAAAALFDKFETVDQRASQLFRRHGQISYE